MNKLNILFISHASGSGGAEQCLFDLIAHINDEKIKVYVNTPYRDHLTAELDKINIPYFVSFTDQWIAPIDKWGIKHFFNFIVGLRSRIWSIQSKIKEHNIDLVYTNSLTCIDGAIAAWRMEVPHIWHIHENLIGNHSIKSYLPTQLTYKIANFFCKNFIAPSNALAHILTNPTIKVHTIFNGIDLKKFKYKTNDRIKTELGLSTSTHIVGQIGSIIPIKGVITFIDSAEKVLATTLNKDLAFVLVGSGSKEYTAVIQNKVAKSPFRQHFHLLGQRQDIPQIINELNIVILASNSEGLPRVVIEAMAAGKPVVATRCGGPEEIIVDGETGFLVPVKDAQAIANKVTYLLEHPNQAQAMGEKGRLRAQKLFSMDQYIQNIEKVIIETVSQTHPNSQ
ncbi:glycosyltransferase family 4 protein [Methylomonas sp. LL1]|uniref:glycosyltransferase family 4 protein n=1 Tax=Methylomonas sp. LL1 TaxID=2785785 RepID=UPI0018C420E8|nr:glycosyltransferase family 4 protein [Methylomonas sp. LL1]QPK65311.1 glycosyltransferase family 4 protein [Methylomonas sp. LL1]